MVEPRVNKQSGGEVFGVPVTLSVAAQSSTLPIIRAVAEQALFGGDWAIDDVADLRLGIDEICSQLIASARPDRALTVVLDIGEQTAVCRMSTLVDPRHEIATTGFGWHVVGTVTDAQSIDYADTREGRLVTVRIAKNRSDIDDLGSVVGECGERASGTLE